MKRKIMALCIVVVMLAVAVIGSTMAYFTDTKEATNVMTMGSVKIELIEQQRNGNGGLEDFEDDKDFLPVTQSIDSYIDLDDNTIANADGDLDDYKFLASNGENIENAIDKIVTVKNTGKSDAYVRVIFAFEVVESIDEIRGSGDDRMIGMMRNDVETRKTTDETLLGNSDWKWEWFNDVVDTKGGKHVVAVATHQKAISAGEETIPSLLQVYLKSHATQEYAEAFGDEYTVKVLAQAVQAAGFADAKTALDTAFDPVEAKNYWATEASDADSLIAALEAGEDVILTDDVDVNPATLSNAYGTTGLNQKNGGVIDGNGNTLDITGAGGTWDSGINTTGGIIKNITVTGSFRGIFVNHNSTHSEPVILDNVTIDGTTYTISCDQGKYQTLTATNSTFKGWTSYAATLGNAKFVDCYFGAGNGYSFMRPYAPTEYVGCEFEAGYTIDPRAEISFENCTLDGVAITSANVADLVTSVDKVTVK